MVKSVLIVKKMYLSCMLVRFLPADVLYFSTSRWWCTFMHRPQTIYIYIFFYIYLHMSCM